MHLRHVPSPLYFGAKHRTKDKGEQVLRPGTVVHLRAMVVHEVSAPEDAAEENVLLLTMLTGERHSTEPISQSDTT